MINKIVLEKWFFMANHLSDDGKIRKHPFLTIGISHDKVVALQFSSVKYTINSNINNSFFSKNNISGLLNLIDVDRNHGLMYHSQADPKLLYVFDMKFLDRYDFRLLNRCQEDKWNEIIQGLQSFIWEDAVINEMVFKWKI